MFQPDKKSSMVLTYNQGFRIYYYSDLKPESIDMVELNYSRLIKLLNKRQILFNVAPYWMRVTDPITVIINPNPNQEVRVIEGNGAPNTVYGIESQLKYKSKRWTVITGGRFIQPEKSVVNIEQEDEQKVVKDVPVFKFKVAGAYDFGLVKASLFADYWSTTTSETFRADHKMTEKYLGGNKPITVEMTETITLPYYLNVNGKIQSKDFGEEDMKYHFWVLGENLLNRKNYHAEVGIVPVKYLQRPINVRVGVNFFY